MSDAPPIIFNPLDPAFIRDPYPTYRQLQTQAPVYRTPLGVWLVSRYRDVSQVLRDPRFEHRFDDMARRRGGARAATSPAFQSLSRWLIVLNPPDHTRLRALLAKGFTARRVEALRPQVQAVIDSLIDDIVADGQADLVQVFNRPLPVIVICQLLGIPESDWTRFMDESCLPPQILAPRPLSGAEIDEMDAAILAIEGYLGELCDARRKQPQDDLTTALVEAEEAGDRLSHDELIATMVLLFFAGHETTVNLISNGLNALFQHPEALARLRAEPALIPNAVEEMLRYDNPAQLAGVRCCTEPVTLSGVELPAGTQVAPLIGAANRDPEVFDDPDTFDIGRSFAVNKVLSFGGGYHHCIGAQLARMETSLALASLLERLPELALENLDEPARLTSYTLRGLSAQPARWTTPAT